MASTYLSRTTEAGTSYNKFTLSAWLKYNGDSTTTHSFFAEYSDGNNFTLWNIKDGSNQLQIFGYDGGSYEYNLTTTRKFRDTNAWYHIVVAFDSTQSTASDRIKIYVNGVQETDFSTSTYPSQNLQPRIANGNRTQIVGAGSTSGNFWGGSMSHVHYSSGYVYSASTFGSTDSTTGEWKINTSPSVTYGGQGFFILKDGNSVTDQSGQSHNLTVGGGTLTKTEDNPSNVFNTFNPLDDYYEAGTFYNGNATYQTGTATGKYSRNTSTLGMTKGKFYWEVKPVSVNASIDYYPTIGITSTQNSGATDYLGKQASDYSIESNQSGGIVKRNNNAYSTWGTYFGLNDIVGVAVDLDNRKIYFSRNGTWMESGDPTSGSTGTGSAYTITAPADTPLGAYFPSVGNYDGTGYVKFEANFGNGYFGTTAVSSAGTNASGNGIFEYNVPAGYTALSTKGLNQ